MIHIELNWTWKLESPLHHGSGLSRPGKADALIQRDGHGNAYVTGDAVKGALRMSAEQILAWQGNAQSYEPYESAEPTQALLQCVFGGQAQAHFAPARLANSDSAPQSMTVSATAINRRTGCADNNTLRTIELLPKGGELTSSCSVWVKDEAEPVAAFLVAALAATEWLGGRTGAGWGRVKPTSVTVTVEGKPIEDISKLLDTDLKLDASATLASAKDEQRGPIATEAQLSWHRLVITLREPTCLGSKPAVANAVDTLDCIPATTLRGAVAAAWLRAGADQSDVLAWLGDETRWTPAFPCIGGVKPAEPTVPVPMSFMVPKNGNGFDIVHDTLTRVAPDEDVQWRKTSARWMSQGKNLEPHQTERETTMHAARDYTTGSKRDGALYSRAHLEEQTSFVAWVKLPAAAVTALPQEIFLGKRTSAGHGAATLEVTQEDKPSFTAKQPDQAEVFVQLLSSAIVRGRSGLPLRSLDAGEWNRLLSAPPGQPLVERVVAKTSSREIPGWMSTWKHGRAAATTIEAGSVWRLIPVAGKVDVLRQALRSHGKDGLGERLHEGFGWLAVDPEWLGRPLHGATQAKGNKGKKPDWPIPDEMAKASNWPGSSLDVSELEDIVHELPTVATMQDPAVLRKFADLRAPLQELAARAREDTATLRSIFAFTKKMTAEPLGEQEDTQEHHRKPGKWAGLQPDQPAREFLRKERAVRDLEHFRFAVEALLIQVGREAHDE